MHFVNKGRSAYLMQCNLGVAASGPQKLRHEPRWPQDKQPGQLYLDAT